MSQSQMLRVLVNERLTAAAEEIFALFEGTIVGIEEELCRSKEENRRKQELLDSVLSPKVALPRAALSALSTRPDPGLQYDMTETPQTKDTAEEQSIKQEEEEDQPTVTSPEFCGVDVKTQEPSPFLQTQYDTQEEDREPDVHSETDEHMEYFYDTDDNEDRRPPLTYSSAQMETKAGGDPNFPTQLPQHIKIGSTAARNSGPPFNYQFAPETSSAMSDGDMPGTFKGSEEKKHQCAFCKKSFRTKQDLQRHLRIHTGEKPYSCSVCNKAFNQNTHLIVHKRTHTGERPYSCPICKRAFITKYDLYIHNRVHTGEKPFSCSICKKTYTHKQSLVAHRKTHTGERPYNCPFCNKAFSRSSTLYKHTKIHSGDTPLQFFNLQGNIENMQ